MRKNNNDVIVATILLCAMAYQCNRLLKREGLATYAGAGSLIGGGKENGSALNSLGTEGLNCNEVKGEHLSDRLTYFKVVLATVLVIILGAFCFFAFQDSVKALLDYCAYAFPILAGIVAGVGVYLERIGFLEGADKKSKVDTMCYQTSVLTLFMGLVSYLSLKVGPLGVIWISFGFAGSILCSALVIVNNARLRKGASDIDQKFTPIARALLVISFAVSGMWFYALAVQNPTEFVAALESAWSKLKR